MSVDLPLNPVAVSKTDSQFYAKHPEMVQDGQRIPLDANDPSQAKMRVEWANMYAANNTPKSTPSTAPAGNKKPGATSNSCPGNLIVTVTDDKGKPIEGAAVKADQLTKTTDKGGIADFGCVPAKQYSISASAKSYKSSNPPESAATVPSKGTGKGMVKLPPCILYKLESPKLVASADEALIGTGATFTDPNSIPGMSVTLTFGQDSTFGTGGVLVAGTEVSDNEILLKADMSDLLSTFAWNDTDGKAKKEFDTFQLKKNALEIYQDPNLDRDIASTPNFVNYPKRVLAAPGMPDPPPGKVRLHQALKAVGWDINAISPITDLGVPALNEGKMLNWDQWSTTGERANGLFAMIDTVAKVRVFATAYEYDSCKEQYTITLVFVLYDMFGLDDEDIRKYGVGATSWKNNLTGAATDITAWWQLQHQHNYAPLVTKATVKPEPFTVPTK